MNTNTNANKPVTKRQKLIQAYGEWLGEHEWEVFGTLTFRGFPSRRRAERRVQTWLDGVKREVGTKNFRMVRVAERGSDGDNLHFHFLFGGLRTISRSDIMRWSAA